MRRYEISNGTKVILYGVNDYARIMIDNLHANGAKVVAFMDANAKELNEYGDMPIFPCYEYPSDLNVAEACIFITLQGAFQHDSIARELYNRGFNKIIFVPMQKCYNEYYAQELRRIYNLLLFNQLNDIFFIPTYELLTEDKIKINNVYDASTHYYIVGIPIENIYTMLPKRIMDNNLKKYADIPLAETKLYLSLFDFLEGKECSINDYLELNGVSACNYANDYEDADILKKRKSLYECWNNHLADGLSFFISSAPPAEWNKKGYFNLLDGTHRSVYLMKKGYTHIPLRILKTEYEKYCKFYFATHE